MTNQSKDNDKVKLLCPQCGGNMEVETQEGTQLLSCPFCGYSEVFEKELTLDEKVIQEHRLAHARESARLQAREEYENKLEMNRELGRQRREKQQRRRKRMVRLIVLGVILSFIGLGVLLSFWNPMLKTIDPFAYVEVTFSGIDGEGTAKLVKLPVDGEANDIRYSVSPKNFLSEGQEVVLHAEDGTFNLKEKNRIYTVSGLDLYVTDTKQLDESAQAYLHELSESAIRSGFEGKGNDYWLGVLEIKYESYSYRPLYLELLSDGQRQNCILDVYEMTFTKGEYSDTAYIAYEITDVVLRQKSATPLSYKKGTFAGDFINLGDSRGWGEKYLGTISGFTSNQAVDAYAKKVAANHNCTVIQKIQNGD